MQLTIVDVTAADRAQGALAKDSAEAAYHAMHEQGAVILRGVFPAAGIDALHAEFAARCGGLELGRMGREAQKPPPNPIQKVGEGRFEAGVRLTGGFGQPGLFGNAILMNFLMPILGGQLMRLASMTVVTSFPGAALQHIHRDHQQLFHEYDNIGVQLPHYAVNVSVPLIDIDEATGPTAIWPGSHRSPSNEGAPEAMASTPFRRGDCVLMDYRVLHAGLPNNSNRPRPILYMVYTREWFFDDNNHRGRAPLDMPLEQIQALPPELHLLMMRAYQQAIRVRQLGGLPLPA